MKVFHILLKKKLLTIDYTSDRRTAVQNVPLSDVYFSVGKRTSEIKDRKNFSPWKVINNG